MTNDDDDAMRMWDCQHNQYVNVNIHTWDVFTSSSSRARRSLLMEIIFLAFHISHTALTSPYGIPLRAIVSRCWCETCKYRRHWMGTSSRRWEITVCFSYYSPKSQRQASAMMSRVKDPVDWSRALPPPLRLLGRTTSACCACWAGRAGFCVIKWN